MNHGKTVLAQVLDGLHPKVSGAARNGGRCRGTHRRFRPTIISRRWCSRNSPIGRACAISRRAWLPGAGSFITRVSVARSSAAIWPTRTNIGTGDVFADVAAVLMRRARSALSGSARGTGLGRRPVRLGRDRDRVEPELVSVGALAESAGIGEAQRAAGSSGRHSCFRQHLTRGIGTKWPRSTRSQCIRAAFTCSTGVFGFPAPASAARGRSFLRHAAQKPTLRYYVAESRPVDEKTGLRCDQTIRLNSAKGRKYYPDPCGGSATVDPETGQALVFLTNSSPSPP